MALRKAPLPIQFSGGVDLRQDEKQVPLTQLIDLQNGVFTRETTIGKRNGYEALSTEIQQAGGDIADARGLAARGLEKLLFTDKRCFSHRPSADRWSDTGEIAATTATTLPAVRTGTHQTQPDHADRNGVRVEAWEDSRNGVWCSVIEADTGRILLSQTQLDSSANARNPRCIACGEVLHVLWTREDLGMIQIAVVNPATPASAPVVSTLTADLDASQPFYDAEAAPAAPSGTIQNRPGVIAWAQAGGGFRVGYIDASGALGSALTGLPSVVTFADLLTGPIAVAHNPTDTIVAVGWIGGASVVRVRRLNASTLASELFVDPVATSSGYTRITLGFGARGTSGLVDLWWAAEVTAARTDLCSVESSRINLSTGTLGPLTRLRGHCLASRAWHDGGDGAATATVRGGDVYALVAHSVRFYPYVAAIRLSDESGGVASPNNTTVARLMPGESAGSLMRPTGAGTRAWTQHLPTVTQHDLAETDIYSRQHSTLIPYRIQLSSQDGDQFSEQGLKLATLNFSVRYQAVELGRGLYLASAAPQHYDGDAWHEADFHCAPDFGFNTTGAPVDMSTAITIGAAGAIPNGTYLYAYWYEAVDAQGELHRGAVSVKMLVTMTGGPKKFSHALPTCRLTRFASARICVARSVAGATGTDSTLPLFKVTANDVTISSGDNRYVTNDPAVDTVAFIDNLTDEQLVLREPLYTNGGILSNDPAPWSGEVIASGKNRLIWTDPTDPNLLRYSQLPEDDVALQAPVALSIPVPALGGRITAVGILDDTIVPFEETATFVIGGPGPQLDPSSSPDVNIFTAAELVTSDVGCVSPASIGQTPLGITFQSRKGIKLLNRARQVLDIGDRVEPLNGQNYTRTTLLPDRTAILYLTDTEDGFSLLWDYQRNQWSKFSNHLGLDAVVVDGVYHYLRTDSRVFRETPGQYRDDNRTIPLRIETAWIHFAQYLQGWQKILWAYWLGSFKSPHTLSVRYRLDYNGAYSTPILNDVNANYDPSLYGAGLYGEGAYGGDGGGGTRYQRRIHLNKRCQGMSFLVEDIEAEGDFGASFELSELLVIGSGIGPDFKVGAARSA